jgi:TfoX-like protein
MAYDEALSKRIDQLIKNKKGFTRKEMFGGVGYLLNGNMCVGVHKNDLIIRYDPTLTGETTSDKNVRPFDITGRPMKGWGLVSSEGVRGDGLNKWFDFSLKFVKSLPAKK